VSLANRQEAIRLGIAIIRDPGLSHILERHAPNVTVCPACNVDDFTHQEGCKLAERVEEVWAWLEDPVEETRPLELGTIVVVT
jgi:hypothetical protein